MVAYEGVELEVCVSDPLADLPNFLGGEQAKVGVTSSEIGLLTDGDAMMSDLWTCQ